MDDLKLLIKDYIFIIDDYSNNWIQFKVKPFNVLAEQKVPLEENIMNDNSIHFFISSIFGFGINKMQYYKVQEIIGYSIMLRIYFYTEDLFFDVIMEKYILRNELLNHFFPFDINGNGSKCNESIRHYIPNNSMSDKNNFIDNLFIYRLEISNWDENINFQVYYDNFIIPVEKIIQHFIFPSDIFEINLKKYFFISFSENIYTILAIFKPVGINGIKIENLNNEFISIEKNNNEDILRYISLLLSKNYSKNFDIVSPIDFELEDSNYKILDGVIYEKLRIKLCRYSTKDSTADFYYDKIIHKCDDFVLFKNNDRNNHEKYFGFTRFYKNEEDKLKKYLKENIKLSELNIEVLSITDSGVYFVLH